VQSRGERAFSRDRPDTTRLDVTLDAIAKDAGVGIGTLYRHFPTCEALIEAAYRSELARLCDAVPELLQSVPPDQAMRAWMDRFVDYMTTKRGMADALRAVIASGGNPYAQSRDRLITALTCTCQLSSAPCGARCATGPFWTGIRSYACPRGWTSKQSPRSPVQPTRTGLNGVIPG